MSEYRKLNVRRQSQVVSGLESDERYRCCCKLIHVRTGAMGISLITTVGSFITHLNGLTAIAIASYVDNEGYVAGGGFQLVWFSLLLFTTFFLFMAILWEKPNFLIPFLIMQILTIALSLLLFGPLVVAVTRDLDVSRPPPSSYLLYPAIGFTVICGLSFLLSIWFFWVVLKFYQFLHHKISLSNPMPSNRTTTGYQPGSSVP